MGTVGMQVGAVGPLLHCEVLRWAQPPAGPSMEPGEVRRHWEGGVEDPAGSHPTAAPPAPLPPGGARMIHRRRISSSSRSAP